ncbi:serine/threonine protein kinase [Streptomyces sp. LRE541]|uniref:serine/threonine-protein kinase n=1 Tax=Streptomyces sp. LRE541 TaxID=2931983 RepID=UPI00200DB0B5|nr:serine/threonine-protein kinase [Streptomyces sp. LRE541]UPZ26802.1 serine/threonine protein kinase [Streptomyces sp. LRE541]
MHHEDAASPDASPERLVADRYRLLSTLGEGGMGTVWRARDEVLRREVAIKEVRAPSGLPAEKIERMYTRLEREAWAAARITAPNVITVHDVVTDGDRPWIVMELVRGRSLAELIRTQGALSPRETARIGAEVLSALRAAHAADVLHRDVKPANVLLADDDRVILTDFGIAMVVGDTALTMTGEVVGSPEYLAPEQALGRALGPATDLWSLGVLLHTAVQGRSPFRQDSALGTLRAVVDDEPPSPHRAGPLTSVIEGLLRKDPAERASAEQTARDLRLIAAGGTPDADVTRTESTPTVTVAAQTAIPQTGTAQTATAQTGGVSPAAQSPSADATSDITLDAPTEDPRIATRISSPDATGTQTEATQTEATRTAATHTAAAEAAHTAATHAAAARAAATEATSAATASAQTGDVRPAAQSGATSGTSETVVDAPAGQTHGSPQVSPFDATATGTTGTTGTFGPAQPAASFTPPQGPPAYSLPTASGPVTVGTPAPAQPGRARRKGYLVAALVTVSALLLGGLGYALTRDDEDRADGKNPGAETSSSAQQAQNGSPSAEGDGSGAAGQPPVTVAVTGTNTTYAGSCPPPQAEAPAFTATFEVTELPVKFTYRWVSAEGSVVDKTWRALTFSEGGPRTHQETIRVTTYAQEGTLASAMGVEIKSSQQTISDTVPFTLTCE